MTYDFDAKLNRDTNAYLDSLDRAEEMAELEEEARFEAHVMEMMEEFDVEYAEDLVTLGELTKADCERFNRLG